MVEEAELKKYGAVETVGGDPPPTPPGLGRTFQIGTYNLGFREAGMVHSPAPPEISQIWLFQLDREFNIIPTN